MSGSYERAVVVMGRLPVAGRVKTRLTPVLSSEDAAGLYEAFLLDVFDLVDHARAQIPFEPLFSVDLAPGEAVEQARAIVPSRDWGVFAQEGAQLGERMGHARDQAGRKHVLVIGSDVPTMPPARLLRAFDALSRGSVDAVFGPTLDGGYNLVGFEHHVTPLMDGIPWSTPEVMAETRRAAARAGLEIAELSVGHDIDDPSDLVRAHNDAIARHPLARRTRAALERALAAASSD